MDMKHLTENQETWAILLVSVKPTVQALKFLYALIDLFTKWGLGYINAKVHQIFAITAITKKRLTHSLK